MYFIPTLMGLHIQMERRRETGRETGTEGERGERDTPLTLSHKAAA